MSDGLKQISDIRMLDGFNEGWIEFANGESWCAKGRHKVGFCSQISDPVES
jgi:hypothetical protein